MLNDDGRRSRQGRDGENGTAGAKGETRGDLVPGKQSLVEATFGSAMQPGVFVQRNEATRTGPDGPPGATSEAGVHAAAAHGISTPSSGLPHRDTIQRLFGSHDISSVQAHTGAESAASARAMSADAYATGNHIVLGNRTDLHTAAHEAAHIIQQRGGVQLKGGVGAADDAYERHADAVADQVVAGRSAAPLLDQLAGGGHSGAAVQRAPAMPSSPGSADPSPSDPAAVARLQGLLTRAGLSVAQQQIPTANLLAVDAARISNLLLQAHPSIVAIGPRMVADRLMRDVISGGGHTSIAAVVQRLSAFDPLILLRPDGYIAHAVTGEAIQRAGKIQFVNGELHAGGLVAGTFYYSNGGVFYRADESLKPMGPPIGELGLEHDAVNSALDGAADALVGVAAGLYQLIRHPIDSIAALRQLPGAISQLIENCPEYWDLFRAKPLNDQIRDISKLVTTLATMYGGAAGATTRIAAAAGELGSVTIRALTLTGNGELAWATVAVPVGTAATALSSGPGAVYVLHMANSSLNNSGGSGSDGGAKPTDAAKELDEIKQKLASEDKLSGKDKRALRTRKRELQEQLGQTTTEPGPEESPTPEPSRAEHEPVDNSGKAIGKGSKVDLDALRNRPAQELISGSLKRSASYAAELAEATVGELLELQQAGGPSGVKAGKMLKLIKDAERLRGKVK
jgi:uncharacterized protein DUF4157